MLEIIIRKVRTLKVVGIVNLTVLSICFLNCSNVDVTTPDEITIDTKHVGMVEGRVTSGAIQNNNLVFVGYSGARIEILNTNFSTTSLTNGTYSIDNVPAGSYNIEAGPSSFGSYWSDVVSVTIVKQTTTRASDHQLVPNSSNQILYGKAYQSDKITPLPNMTVKLHVAVRPNMDPGTVKSSTVTSLDGSFAFYRGNNDFVITANGKKLIFIDSSRDYIILSGSGNELVRKNIYLP